jgi:ATP-binding cassette subfamily F protein uup
LELEIPKLESEKVALEAEMSSGSLTTDQLLEKAKRVSEVIEQIDNKTMRWLELSEMV